MKKISTVQIFESEIFKEQRLTIGMDLGDHWSCYCILDEAGKILREQRVTTTPEALKQAFAKMPRSLIALETGTHSPWVRRPAGHLGRASDLSASLEPQQASHPGRSRSAPLSPPLED